MHRWVIISRDRANPLGPVTVVDDLAPGRSHTRYDLLSGLERRNPHRTYMLYRTDLPVLYPHLPNRLKALVVEEALEMNRQLDDDEYVNEGCPAGCCFFHEAPDAGNCDGVFTCPHTDDRYRFCSSCGWEEMNRYCNEPTLIDGEWYCDPFEHDMRTCDSCQEWNHCDDMNWSERNDEEYCNSCYEQNDSPESAPGQRRALASCCNTYNDYFHEDHERFICKCQADKARAQREPVLMVSA